jgi:Tfp pilus assembly protein PilN
MSSSPNQLSFLPDDYLERKAQRRTNVVCAILFLMVTVAIGVAFTHIERTLKQARKTNDDVSRQHADAARPIQQFQQLQDKQRTMAQQAELTSSLLEKVPRTYLLAEITNAMPAGLSLLDLAMESKARANVAPAVPAAKTAFEQKKAELKAKQAGTAAAAPARSDAPAPKLYDVNLKLTGVARTDVQVAQFISKLGQSRVIKEANLLISDEWSRDQEQLRKFQIEVVLDPKADVGPGAQHDSTRTTAAVELRTGR